MAQSLTQTEQDKQEQTHCNQWINDYGTAESPDYVRLFYGKPEIQISENEGDLHKHFNSCEKNPGHKEFIPLIDFSLGHLPGHDDQDIVELIKAIADLTIRIDVKMTSPERPEFWPNSKEPYALYPMRGSSSLRIGTGMVFSVDVWPEEFKGPCICPKCKDSDTPSSMWGQVMMWTATHVIFDELEAKHTKCRLFYDSKDSLLVTLDDWMIMNANIEEDRCTLKCVTCDVDLLEKLFKMWKRWSDLLGTAADKYNTSRDEHKLTFIVSHPHGCPKQVSVGHWITRYSKDDHWTKYTYTTCTCPGSSGPVSTHWAITRTGSIMCAMSTVGSTPRERIIVASVGIRPRIKHNFVCRYLHYFIHS